MGHLSNGKGKEEEQECPCEFGNERSHVVSMHVGQETHGRSGVTETELLESHGDDVDDVVDDRRRRSCIYTEQCRCRNTARGGMQRLVVERRKVLA